MRIDLVDLRLFVLVAGSGSISRGAAAAHLAVSSASERVQKLEDEVGTALFERQPRGVRLTAAGEDFLARANAVLVEVARLREGVATPAAPARLHLRLLANTAALTHFLPELLASFLARYPQIDLDLEERPSPHIARELAAGNADLGLFSSAVKARGLKTCLLARDDIVLLVPAASPLAKRAEIRLREVRTAPFVGLSRGVPFQDHVESRAQQLGIALNVRARVREMQALCRMVEAGAGLGLVSRLAADRMARSMAIAPVRLRERWAARSLVLGIPGKRSPRGPLLHLVEHLKTAAQGRVASLSQ